jgi:hypothetical protein
VTGLPDANRIAIDFVAHHDIQAQAALSIFEDLSADFDCRWLIGPDRQPSGAAAALLIDHAPFQPRIRKSLSGYRYLFHILHDLADLPVYDNERRRLSTCDLLLVPGPLHREHALRALGSRAVVHEIGWPKYDRMEIPTEHAAFTRRLEALPHPFTVLYTPTRAFTYEWRYLLPWLRELRCNTILKNHIYVNPGQPLPAGCEAEYEASMRSADEMEATLTGDAVDHMIVAPRRLNVCALFPHAHLAIADQSSVVAEFLPFGISVETGRYTPREDQSAPEISRMFPDVVYLPRTELGEAFGSPASFEAFVAAQRRGSPRKGPAPVTVPAGKAGGRGAAIIRRLLDHAEKAPMARRVLRQLARCRGELAFTVNRGLRALRHRLVP